MGAHETRHQFTGLFSLYEWVLIVAAAIVYLAVLYAIVRYRRRDDSYPRGRSEAKVAESIYAVLIACVVGVLVYATFMHESRIDRVSARPALTIDVVGFQWQWRFDYRDSGISVVGTDATPPTIVVPARTLIEFTATSQDVIHSFWIPGERFKRDAFPNRMTRFDLAFEKEGSLLGHCAEFCGLRHSNMDFHVDVVSASRFRSWVEAHKA